MLERTGAITNEVIEPITFVLAYPIVLFFTALVPSAVTVAKFDYSDQILVGFFVVQS
jgi:hypothetical protein